MKTRERREREKESKREEREGEREQERGKSGRKRARERREGEKDSKRRERDSCIETIRREETSTQKNFVHFVFLTLHLIFPPFFIFQTRQPPIRERATPLKVAKNYRPLPGSKSPKRPQPSWRRLTASPLCPEDSTGTGPGLGKLPFRYHLIRNIISLCDDYIFY